MAATSRFIQECSESPVDCPQAKWSRITAPLRGRGYALTIVAIVVITLLAMTALGTSSAGAAAYRANRTGLGIFFRVESHRVAEFRINYTLHCSNGRVRRAVTRLPELNRPIKRQSGKFTYRFESNSDFSESFNERMVGYVGRQRIAGRFRGIMGNKFCWTGRSRANTWIRFDAQRVRPPAGGLG